LRFSAGILTPVENILIALKMVGSRRNFKWKGLSMEVSSLLREEFEVVIMIAVCDRRDAWVESTI
jgi:hypothetical protein